MGAEGVMGERIGKRDRGGDAWEPFAYGQKAWAFHIATKFGIELMFYGENGELEYGGSEAYKNKPMEGPEEWEVEYFKGTSVEKLAKIAVQRGIFTAEEEQAATMQLYRPPPTEVIQQTKVEMHWFSYVERIYLSCWERLSRVSHRCLCQVHRRLLLCTLDFQRRLLFRDLRSLLHSDLRSKPFLGCMCPQTLFVVAPCCLPGPALLRQLGPSPCSCTCP